MKNTFTQSVVETLALQAVLAVLALPAMTLPAMAAQNNQTHLLRSGRKPGDVDRVAVVLEVGGELKEMVDNKIHRPKLSVVCNLTYDEKTLEVPAVADGRVRSIRHYDKIDTVIKVEDEGLKPTLRTQRQLIATEAEGGKLTLFSPLGTLSRDELELINILGNSLLLDRLLPARPVAVGDSWKHSDKLIAAMFRLDAVAKVEAGSKLTEVTDQVARFEMSGHVEGASGGVSTTIDLKAKYRFNLATKRIDWLGLLVKEDRDIGHVTDGVDATARLQVQVAPRVETAQLNDAALAGLSLEPSNDLTQLIYRPKSGDWQFVHDRSWHVTGDRADLAVLRMLDRGDLLAQCNVAPLPKREPGGQLSLAEFQADVQKSLGDSFGEFVEAGQAANEANYRVHRVVVRGKVEDLPIQWNYYLVADQHGNQVVFAFTVEQSLTERLGKADEKLVGALRFIVPQTAEKETDGLR